MNIDTRKPLTKKEKRRQAVALHNADFELAKFNEAAQARIKADEEFNRQEANREQA